MSRWILLQLTTNLKKHVASTCKVRKYGTLIYRPNTDLLSVISQLLWKIRGLEINKSDDNIPENTCKFKDYSDQVLDNLNKRIHSSIKTLLATDAKIPSDYSKFNINNSIQQIDSDLWIAVCTLTKSVSECRGTSMVNDRSSHIYESKQICRHFLFSTILFCTDDRCCMPLHTPITDMVESQGGSAFQNFESIRNLLMIRCSFLFYAIYSR